MEHLGCRNPMDIRVTFVRLDQLLVPGNMREHTKLDLGIVRVRKQIVVLWHKYLADQPSQLCTHRNVLQIRFR